MELDVVSVSGINTPLQVRVLDVPPGERVRVTLFTADIHHQPWSCTHVFHADEHGVVDLATALPESAQWGPANSLGPLWTLRPESAGDSTDDYFAFELSGLAAMQLQLKVRIEGEGLGALLQRVIAREVEEFEGPSGTTGYVAAKPAPGIVMLSDVPTSTASAGAAALSHHKFTTFYSPKMVTVDELQRIHEHEYVDDTVPLGLVAYGKACSYAFELAAKHPEFIGPVVAHSPADVLFPQPGRKEFWWAGMTGRPAKLRDFYDSARQGAASISLEGMVGPLLLTAGTDDAIWDSHTMTANLEQKATAAGVEVFRAVYDGAGHASGYPFTFPGLPAATVINEQGHRIALGGDPNANGHAAELSRAQVISFFASTYDIPTDI